MKSLRELFQQVRASNFGANGRIGVSIVLGCDVLTRLPIELHILLLEYLCAEDIVSALNASKTLRLAWLSDDVWPWLADRWYPDLSQAIWIEAGRRDGIFKRLITLGRSTGDHLLVEFPMRSKKKVPPPSAPEASELFRQMLGRLCRRNGGKYGSALHHRMQLLKDPVFSLSKNVPLDDGGITSTNDLDDDLLESAKLNVSRFMMYNNGRIAWWPNSYSAPYIAVVDNLRTTRRKIYRFPNHDGIQRGYKTAMSDELLVMARNTSIYAWHFEEDILSSIVVPDQLERCIAEGSNVLIITKSAELYIWRFGERIASRCIVCYRPGPVRMGGLVEAPFQSHSPMFHIPRRQGLVLKENGMLLDFVLHPSLRGVLFVVTMHEGELLVHEIDQGKPVGSYPLHADSRTMAEQWKDINEYLRWEKCDSYGGYCLFSVYFGIDNEISPSDLQSPDKPFCTCGQSTGLVSVCFNIYTKAFRLECHHFLHSHDQHVAPVPAAFHLWQNRLYSSYAPEDMRAGMPLTALRCCLEVQEQQHDVNDSNIPVYTISEKNQGFLTRRHQALRDELSDRSEPQIQRNSWQRQVGFGLDVTGRCAPKAVRSRTNMLWNWDASNVHQKQTIVGDDDFLLYVVDGVYTAWSFGDEIPIPKEVVRWVPWA